MGSQKRKAGRSVRREEMAADNCQLKAPPGIGRGIFFRG